jgi:hypothetical protein
MNSSPIQCPFGSKKFKASLFVCASLIAGAVGADAAMVMITNIERGPGDTLYANSDGSLMNGGLVTLGYFPVEVTTSDVNTVEKLLARLSTFTVLAAAVPGTSSPSLGQGLPGYVEQLDYTSKVFIGYLHPLLGRTLYSVITSAPSLGEANLTSQFALLAMTTLKLDIPFEHQYLSNPTGLAPIIGTLGTFTGDAGGGFGVYHTLEMVPEASIFLLGSLGALSLLRRRLQAPQWGS